MRSVITSLVAAAFLIVCTLMPAIAQPTTTKRIIATASNQGKSTKFDVSLYIYFEDGTMSQKIFVAGDLPVGSTVNVKVDVHDKRPYTLYVTWLEKGAGTAVGRAARFEQPTAGNALPWNAVTVQWTDSAAKSSLPTGFELATAGLGTATPPP